MPPETLARTVNREEQITLAELRHTVNAIRIVVHTASQFYRAEVRKQVQARPNSAYGYSGR